MKKCKIGIFEVIFILLIIMFVGIIAKDPTISNLGELEIVIQEQ